MVKIIIKIISLLVVKVFQFIFLILNSKLTSIVASTSLAYSFILIAKHPKIITQFLGFKVFVVLLIYYHLYFGIYSILKDYSYSVVFNVACSLFFSTFTLIAFFYFF